MDKALGVLRRRPLLGDRRRSRRCGAERGWATRASTRHISAARTLARFLCRAGREFCTQQHRSVRTVAFSPPLARLPRTVTTARVPMRSRGVSGFTGADLRLFLGTGRSASARRVLGTRPLRRRPWSTAPASSGASTVHSMDDFSAACTAGHASGNLRRPRVRAAGAAEQARQLTLSSGPPHSDTTGRRLARWAARHLGGSGWRIWSRQQCAQTGDRERVGGATVFATGTGHAAVPQVPVRDQPAVRLDELHRRLSCRGFGVTDATQCKECVHGLRGSVRRGARSERATILAFRWWYKSESVSHSYHGI